MVLIARQPTRQLRPHATGMRSRWIIPPRPGGWDQAIFEWELEAAKWTDEHHHTEVNVVIEGELSVTSDGLTIVAGPGDAVVVEAGKRGAYSAPRYARMIGCYGPNAGEGDEFGEYEDL